MRKGREGKIRKEKRRDEMNSVEEEERNGKEVSKT